MIRGRAPGRGRGGSRSNSVLEGRAGVVSAVSGRRSSVEHAHAAELRNAFRTARTRSKGGDKAVDGHAPKPPALVSHARNTQPPAHPPGDHEAILEEDPVPDLAEGHESDEDSTPKLVRVNSDGEGDAVVPSAKALSMFAAYAVSGAGKHHSLPGFGRARAPNKAVVARTPKRPTASARRPMTPGRRVSVQSSGSSSTPQHTPVSVIASRRPTAPSRTPPVSLRGRANSAAMGLQRRRGSSREASPHGAHPPQTAKANQQPTDSDSPGIQGADAKASASSMPGKQRRSSLPRTPNTRPRAAGGGAAPQAKATPFSALRATSPARAPMRTPVRATSPVRTPVRATSPVRTPVRATSPSRPAVRATSPVRTPVRAASPARPPVRAAAPVRTPVRAASPARAVQLSALSRPGVGGASRPRATERHFSPGRRVPPKSAAPGSRAPRAVPAVAAAGGGGAASGMRALAGRTPMRVRERSASPVRGTRRDSASSTGRATAAGRGRVVRVPRSAEPVVSSRGRGVAAFRGRGRRGSGRANGAAGRVVAAVGGPPGMLRRSSLPPHTPYESPTPGQLDRNATMPHVVCPMAVIQEVEAEERRKERKGQGAEGASVQAGEGAKAMAEADGRAEEKPKGAHEKPDRAEADVEVEVEVEEKEVGAGVASGKDDTRVGKAQTGRAETGAARADVGRARAPVEAEALAARAEAGRAQANGADAGNARGVVEEKPQVCAVNAKVGAERADVEEKEVGGRAPESLPGPAGANQRRRGRSGSEAEAKVLEGIKRALGQGSSAARSEGEGGDKRGDGDREPPVKINLAAALEAQAKEAARLAREEFVAKHSGGAGESSRRAKRGGDGESNTAGHKAAARGDAGVPSAPAREDTPPSKGCSSNGVAAPQEGRRGSSDGDGDGNNNDDDDGAPEVMVKHNGRTPVAVQRRASGEHEGKDDEGARLHPGLESESESSENGGGHLLVMQAQGDLVEPDSDSDTDAVASQSPQAPNGKARDNSVPPLRRTTSFSSAESLESDGDSLARVMPLESARGDESPPPSSPAQGAGGLVSPLAAMVHKKAAGGGSSAAMPSANKQGKKSLLSSMLSKANEEPVPKTKPKPKPSYVDDLRSLRNGERSGKHQANDYAYFVKHVLNAQVGQPKRYFDIQTKSIADIYDFKEDVGNGGYSVVRRGIHRQTGQEYAIKVVQADVFEAHRMRMEAEAAVLGAVRHPAIVRFFGVVRTPTEFCFVMELLRGGELFDQIIEHRDGYPEYQACHIVKTILEAVAHLHAHGVVHRDIKPENFLYDGRHEVITKGLKLIDFGFATFQDPEHDMVGSSCGTPDYIAPELLVERPHNKSVDMWSVGVVLYILLSGSPPFYAEDDDELFMQIASGDYSFPPVQWDHVSESARDLVRGLLQVCPDDRLTAREALRHPWILHNTEVNEQIIEEIGSESDEEE